MVDGPAVGGGPGGGFGGLVGRWLDGSFPAWSRQVMRAGFCWRPVRISGAAHAVDGASGEVLASFDSGGEPDGTLLVACGDRRASVCAPCAETYRRDTWHLIGAGMRGKALRAERPSYRAAVATANLPADFSGHPFMWATLTAPSFGAAHRHDANGGRCRPRRGAGCCEHWVPLGCDRVHGADDPVVGTPVCPECYDYAGAVLWNATVPALWQRTLTDTYRALARLGSELAGPDRSGARLTGRTVRKLVRVSYVKVAEWQRRGVIHLHVIARLDGVDPGDRTRVVPPPGWASGELLADAFTAAVERAAAPLPFVHPELPAAVWGEQMHADMVTADDAAAKTAYLAKYCTKAAGDVLDGLPVQRMGPDDVADLRAGRIGATEHARRLALAALDLGEYPECADLRLIANAHQAGFRGHFMSRSRHYSATRAALRAERRAYSATHDNQDGNAALSPWKEAARGDDVAVVGNWRFVASGYATLTDREIAARLAARYAEGLEELRHQQAEDRAIAEQD